MQDNRLAEKLDFSLSFEIIFEFLDVFIDIFFNFWRKKIKVLRKIQISYAKT